MTIHVGRFINRASAQFTVEVLTPMFLGGADGNAELRSPPFKNALRYWWRLTQGDVDKDKLLLKEQALFGGVHEKQGMTSSRSQVDVVVKGDVNKNSNGSYIDIGKKRNIEANNANTPLSGYLGMGPIHFRTGTNEKEPISPGESFSLSVSWPRKHHDEMIDALSLFSHFGCLGARSRNGWGSINLSVTPSNKSDSPIKLKSLKSLFQKYGMDTLTIFNQEKSYPFRLGLKNSVQPLLWRIKEDQSWNQVMKAAGGHYMEVRQTLTFPKMKPQGVQKRHILGYPVTNHPLREWGGFNGRMPSQLRIIVRKTSDGRYVSYFFHLPHRIPKEWNPTLGKELSVWQQIHDWLDANCTPITL